MLTRLRVSGFKNLVDADLRFGPFTCVAGVNGAGKSNLFDAIAFLGVLAAKPLAEAALSVREEGAKAGDVRRLFHQAGETFDSTMKFVAEMIVPEKATDDFGQTAKATTTFLEYTLELGFRPAANGPGGSQLEIRSEQLTYLPRNTASQRLLFPHSIAWRDSVLQGARRGAAFISTAPGEGGSRHVMLHQDGGSGGPGLVRPVAKLPRTTLSGANAAESPTCLCVKREMESWRILQLEPSALRQPDELNAPWHMDAHGRHLPSTLYHLANSAAEEDGGEAAVYREIANRLSELIRDIRSLQVDRDEKRELMTLMASGKDGTAYPARSLSDGTLRFIALAVLQRDVEAQGLICLEEPENSIHPARIPAILKLLEDIAMNPHMPVDETNPLRQVIINTHSPSVVREAPDESLLLVSNPEIVREGKLFSAASFMCLPETWRVLGHLPAPTISRGDLSVYLNPAGLHLKTPGDFGGNSAASSSAGRSRRRPRVIDRKDLQPLLPGFDEE